MISQKIGQGKGNIYTTKFQQLLAIEPQHLDMTIRQLIDVFTQHFGITDGEIEVYDLSFIVMKRKPEEEINHD